jgi:hypothetical protein
MELSSKGVVLTTTDRQGFAQEYFPKRITI